MRHPCVPSSCIFIKSCRLGSYNPLHAASTFLLPAVTHQFLLSRTGCIKNHKPCGASVRHTWYVTASSSLPPCLVLACVSLVQAGSPASLTALQGTANHLTRHSCLFSRLCSYSHQPIIWVPFPPLSTCSAPAWALSITSSGITTATPPVISPDLAVMLPVSLLLLR